MSPGTHLTPDDRRAWDLIPWVVAGTASDAERALVDAHVARCTDCAAEFAFQRRVRSAVAASVAAPPPEVEPALRRMMARIDAGGDAPAAVARAPSALPRARAAGVPARWLAVAGVVVIVQAVALAALVGNGRDRRPDAAYTTLSAPSAGRATLRLVPAPSMSLQALRDLLAGLDLEVVDVSADGTFFGLVPRHPGPAGDAAALAVLRATPGVLLAEPIARPGSAAHP